MFKTILKVIFVVFSIAAYVWYIFLLPDDTSLFEWLVYIPTIILVIAFIIWRLFGKK